MSSGTQDVSEPIREKAMPTAPFWMAPWRFAVHALVGTSIFTIIAVAAVALELVVQTFGIKS